MTGRARGLGGSLLEGWFLKNDRIRMAETSHMRKKMIYSWISAIVDDDDEGNVGFLYSSLAKNLDLLNSSISSR